MVCTVERVRARPTRRRNLVIVEASVRDESGPGVVIWFNQRYLAKQLQPGMRLSIRGERRQTIDAEIVAKSYERADDDSGGLHTSGLVPVYPASERVSEPPAPRAGRRAARARRRSGRPAARPHQAAAGAAAPARRADGLPPARDPGAGRQRAGRGWRSTSSSCSSWACSSAARTSMRSPGRCRCRPPGELSAQYLAALPFELTGAQARAIAAIDADVVRDRPMRRLLQGDVGSGKTAVAAHALVRAVESGGQGALMAPTETLATQHLIGLSDLLIPLGCARHRPDAGNPGRRAPGGGRRGRRRRPAGRRRHPRADPGPGHVRDAAGRGRRRAAPVRGRAAAGARGEVPLRHLAARPAHDRDAHPADAGAHGLRRSRRVGARRDAARADARGDARAAPRPPRRGVRAHAPPARRGPPGVRRLPARRRERGRPRGRRRGVGGRPGSARASCAGIGSPACTVRWPSATAAR